MARYKSTKLTKIDKKYLFNTIVMSLASLAYAVCALVYLESYLEWAIFIAVIIGLALMIYKMPYAFVLWLTAAIIYTYMCYKQSGVSVECLFGSVILIMNIIALYKWR